MDMRHLLSGVAIVAALAIAVPALAQRSGPGPGAQTTTGPGVYPPRGARAVLFAPQSAGRVSRSDRCGALGDAPSANYDVPRGLAAVTVVRRARLNIALMGEPRLHCRPARRAPCVARS